jgi:hypothetical protein
MPPFYKTTFLILFVACIALSGRGQSGGITVRFIANCSLEMTDGIYFYAQAFRPLLRQAGQEAEGTGVRALEREAAGGT